jgi:ATP-binding cassette subfamily B protein
VPDPDPEPEPSRSGGLRSPGWRLLVEALRPQRVGLLLGMLIALGWTAARVAVPRLVQLGIDRSIQGDDPLWRWAALVALAGAVSGVFLGLRRYVAFRNARAVEARMRDRLFAHIQRLHSAYHDRVATGELMSRVNTDLNQFQNVVTMVPITTGNALIVISAAAVMFILQPTLALLAVVGLPLVNILGRRFSQQLHKPLVAVQEQSAEVAGVVEETLSGMRVVKGFGFESTQDAKLGVAADELFEQSLETSGVRARFLPAIELVPNLGLVAVLAYGGHLAIEGDLTVGELVGFNLYVVMLIQPLRMLGMVVAQAQRAIAAGERIDEVLATAPQIVDPAHPRSLPPRSRQTGAVEFRNVSFHYENEGDPLPVLDDLDLRIEAGESVAIVGATGCGKSTVARLLPRFYDVTGGAILLDGIDVRQLRRRELRRAVSLVFEDTFLFSGSVYDNIAFADPAAPEADVHRAAMLAGASDFIEQLERGFDTPLGERGYSLSGGQRQRIAIARAILADPRVLILDDATSAVDPSKEHEIRDAMAEVMDGRTTIVIAHRPATIALADRVVLLDDGRIVAEGPHEDLLAASARYREVLASSHIDPESAAVPETAPSAGGA